MLSVNKANFPKKRKRAKKKQISSAARSNTTSINIVMVVATICARYMCLQQAQADSTVIEHTGTRTAVRDVFLMISAGGSGTNGIILYMAAAMRFPRPAKII